MVHNLAIGVTLAAVAAIGGSASAAEPVDRACLFPTGWQYRCDPNDKGREEGWFRPDHTGPWDDLPEDPKERARCVRDWHGAVWLRARVTLPPAWRGESACVGFSRARWPDDLQVWWGGARLKPVTSVTGPAAGSQPVALVSRIPLPDRPERGSHALVVRSGHRGGDPFEAPTVSAGSSIILASREGDIAGWFEVEPFRRAWLVRRFADWVWPKAMVNDRLWLVHHNAPSPVHTGVIGDRHEPAMTQSGGVILYDGDDRLSARHLVTIVPWVYDHGSRRLFTCEEAETARWQLRKGSLPIPEIAWQAGPARVYETLYADRFGPEGEWVAALLRIAVVNTAASPAEVSLYVAAHQRMATAWAVPLRTVACQPAAGQIRANGRLILVSDSAAADGGCLGFTDGAVSDVSAFARLGGVPPARRARDARGMASAALRFRLSLKPGESRQINLRIPAEYYFPLTKYRRYPPSLTTVTPRDIADPVAPAERLARLERGWRTAVPVRLDIPDAAVRDLFYASVYNLLLGLDGDVPYAGPTLYSTQVFHDAGDILAALAMAGVRDEVDQSARELAARQDEGGVFAGWGEDAARRQGRIGWGIVRAGRLRRDLRLTREVWPAVARAADVVRASAAHARQPELAHTPRFGLVDRDIRGSSRTVRYAGNWACAAFLAEASRMARTVARPEAAQRLAEAAERLRKDLAASLERVTGERFLPSLPIGVDAGGQPTRGRCSFDGALAHAPALIAGRPAGLALPEDLLRRAYRDAFQAGTRGGGWCCGTDRFVGQGAGPGAAMVMLGLRHDAYRGLRFLVDSQTGPGALSEWDVRTDRAHRLYGRWCRGSGPVHLWSAALFVIQVRTMFLYEEGDGQLALLAGVPAEWLGEGQTAALSHAPTHFGLVSIRCTSRIKAGRVDVEILPESDPPEGYRLFLPFDRPVERLRVDGRSVPPSGDLATGVRLPVGARRVVVEFKPSAPRAPGG